MYIKHDINVRHGKQNQRRGRWLKNRMYTMDMFLVVLLHYVAASHTGWYTTARQYRSLAYTGAAVLHVFLRVFLPSRRSSQPAFVTTVI